MGDIGQMSMQEVMDFFSSTLEAKTLKLQSSDLSLTLPQDRACLLKLTNPNSQNQSHNPNPDPPSSFGCFTEKSIKICSGGRSRAFTV